MKLFFDADEYSDPIQMAHDRATLNDIVNGEFHDEEIDYEDEEYDLDEYEVDEDYLSAGPLY